jgi:hypothetical protein
MRRSTRAPHFTEEEPPDKPGGTRLLVAATAVKLALGLVPGLGQRAEYGAERFRDRTDYVDRVLHGRPMPQSARLPFAIEHTSGASLLYGVGAVLVALLTAAFGLWRGRLPGARRRATGVSSCRRSTPSGRPTAV